MAEVIRMPLLSDTMTEGVIAEWHKKVGDKVKSDDVIADVETDKATMEVMAYAEGTLLYVGVEKGKAAKVNEIIAIVGKEGEDYKSLLDAPAPAASGNPEPQQHAAPAAAAQPEPATSAPATSAPATVPAGVTVVRMPLLSDTMTEGKIVAWNKKEGDTVKSDDVLAEVETDKATMEVMGYADGTLLYIGVPEGQAAKVNDIIAIVGKPGTDIKPLLQQPAPANGAAVQNAAPASAPSGPTPMAPVVASENYQGTDERLKISPLARKIAKDKGIDLSQLHGSGDNGRIVKRDLESYQPAAQAQPSAGKPASTAPMVQAPSAQEGHTDTPVSQMRKVIAKRLAESKFTAPHFYLRMTITMDNAIEARKHINNISPVKVSFNDLIIKASAMALRKHPEVNSSWISTPSGDVIRQNHHIHIGSAVAVDEGLIVPVVRFADQLSLSQIASASGELYAKARNKKLQPNEFSGNTFTISNLGMMDIDEFTAIINPPDSCILAVGKIAPTPVVEDGQIVVRQLLKLTLSCDHRTVDGAVGARFLQTLKSFLENPVTMLA